MGELTDAIADRIDALRRGGPGAAAAFLQRLPLIAAAAAGTGPMSQYGRVLGHRLGRPAPVADIGGLARLIADPMVVAVALMSATRIEQQLAQLAHFHGGTLGREEALQMIGADPDALDRGASGLAELFLSNPKAGWISLRPGVADQVRLPGIRVRDTADFMMSDQIASILRRLGVMPLPGRKSDRIAALEAALRDRGIVERAIASLDSEDQARMAKVLKRGHVGLDELGSRYDSYRGRGSVHTLASMGLIGYSHVDDTAWVWLDVVAAIGGANLFSDWSEPQFTSRPLADSMRPVIPSVIGRLDQMLDHWATNPPQGLKAGGIGVRPVRAAAKALRATPAEIGLLTVFAAEEGLVAPVVTARRGRGRNQTVDEQWHPTTERDEWRAAPPAHRWARLVRWWLESLQLSASGETVERYQWESPQLNRPLTRSVFLQDLSALEPGEALDQADLRAKLVFDHCGLFAPAVVDQLIAEARILGLVPVQGPVGLTAAGRLLVAGAEALEDVLGDAAASFTVQADHSVVAPPDIHPDVAAQLDRIGHLESDAGARIYRITPEDTVRALDAGWTAETILGFLADHSTVPVPQNVERTIRDAADRHGKLQVGSAATWVASDDPAALVRALAVKAARLESITPTLAVSELPRDKVLDALRAKGLAPAERVDATPQVQSVGRGLRLVDTKPIRLVLQGPDEIDALARRLCPGRAGAWPTR
ncbi:MAG: helicase-associated domain-containing protein [Actinomycetota bacterium]